MTVTVNESLLATAVAIEHDHCDDGSGEATVTITNGLGPFVVSWETNDNMEQGTQTITDPGSLTITNLNGGATYCFYVTDANGCTVVP